MSSPPHLDPHLPQAHSHSRYAFICVVFLFDAAFLLTVGSFQLIIIAFLLTVGVFLFTALASLITIGAFCLQWESASNKRLEGLQAKKLNCKQKGSNCKLESSPLSFWGVGWGSCFGGALRYRATTTLDNCNAFSRVSSEGRERLNSPQSEKSSCP